MATATRIVKGYPTFPMNATFHAERVTRNEDLHAGPVHEIVRVHYGDEDRPGCDRTPGARPPVSGPSPQKPSNVLQGIVQIVDQVLCRLHSDGESDHRICDPPLLPLFRG